MYIKSQMHVIIVNNVYFIINDHTIIIKEININNVFLKRTKYLGIYRNSTNCTDIV